jgi:hypothetical protein
MTGARFYVDIGTSTSLPQVTTYVTVYEDEITSSIFKADLKMLGISRADLDRVFAKARELMRERGIEPGDRNRIRPVADKMRDGGWDVVLVGYSEFNDPLLNYDDEVPPRGKRN